MQQPIPHNTTGVPVTLSVVDANGNYRTIGTTTSDGTGAYGFTLDTRHMQAHTPVIATFSGIKRILRIYCSNPRLRQRSSSTNINQPYSPNSKHCNDNRLCNRRSCNHSCNRHNRRFDYDDAKKTTIKYSKQGKSPFYFFVKF